MTDLPRTADILARRLYEAGCRRAFGMPGGEVLTMIDALDRAGIAFALVKHENAAGFMAEGAWHLTGAPGILVATLGPGAMNAVNAVANAHQDRVPMIVLTGCVDAGVAETYTHQVLDQRAVFAPITKAGFRLTHEAPDVIADKAARIALAPRAGPVHIDVPIGVAETRVAQRTVASTPASPAAPAPGAELDRARAALRAAERPIILAGLDTLENDAAHALRHFAEATGAPVVTTYRAKGVLPEDHPLALGGAGLSPLADTHLLPLFRAADTIVLAGYDPIEMRPGWQDVWTPSRQTVIDITSEPNRHYMHQASIVFETDPSATLGALAPPEPGSVWQDGAPAAAKAALARAFPSDETWGPGAIVDTCRRLLPEDGIATVDSGAHRILLSQMWRCPAPRTLLQSAALCTMGCAIPLALGAQLAAEDRKVIAFTGDAGFLMVAGELASAAELGLPVVVVVFVDASLALIEKKQRERQLPNAGVDFATHDFAAMGQAFGGHGATVSNRGDLEAALRYAFAADRFTVIAAHIERGCYDGRI